MMDPILIVDDDPGTRKVARANLSLEGFDVLLAANAEMALALLHDNDPLALVSDLKMPGMDGIALMDRAHQLRPGLPVLLVTAHATVETAVAALHRGARHYLTKPINFEELALVLRHAVVAERARRDLENLRGELERVAGFEEMVGDSPQMRRVFALVEQVAGADATVLVQGETGTGKELVARAIHRRSPRHEQPFVAVNCSAIPRELMESEFFGHERGAFTGATARRVGSFEQADRSTLFLDEVGDLDIELQGKLLRALQEREFVRVGGEKPVAVDVRIVAATHHDLAAEVAAGRFREDLFYRLNVLPIELPALRLRTSDIPALMAHFLGSFGRRYGREVPPPPPEMVTAAATYPWPGNVRELRNLCERAALMGWQAVEPILHPRTADSAVPETNVTVTFHEAKRQVIAQFELRYLDELLRRHGGRVGASAAAAGLTERSLYEKMKTYGLAREDYH